MSTNFAEQFLDLLDKHFPQNNQLHKIFNRNTVKVSYCVVTATVHPRKVYLGAAEGDFKQRYYNHKKSFRNRKYATETSLSKHIWEMKDKHNISPNLIWCIIKSVPGYSNISKRCMLCLHEKY